MLTDLGLQVKSDIEGFLASNTELLFNERDLQMRLSIFLLRSKNNYDDVDLEYHLPAGFNKKFDKDYKDWKTEKPSIDLVVRKDREYVPIELKYKLKAVNGSISRFGEKSGSIVEIIPNQSAQNLGRYAFWKDVKRIELTKKHYSSVKCGLAVFVTNDKNYLSSTQGSDYYEFGMDSGRVINGHLDWSKSKDNYPAINLDGSYMIEWKQFSMHPLMKEAYYTIVTI